MEKERERERERETEQAGREQNSVERYVILSHEHVQRHVSRVLPPTLPLRGVAFRDGEVADGGVVPHIKHLRGGRKG